MSETGRNWLRGPAAKKVNTGEEILCPIPKGEERLVLSFFHARMGRHYIIPIYSLKWECATWLGYTPTRTCSLFPILISLIKAKDKDSDFSFDTDWKMMMFCDWRHWACSASRKQSIQTWRHKHCEQAFQKTICEREVCSLWLPRFEVGLG